MVLFIIKGTTPIPVVDGNVVLHGVSRLIVPVAGRAVVAQNAHVYVHVHKVLPHTFWLENPAAEAAKGSCPYKGR